MTQYMLHCLGREFDSSLRWVNRIPGLLIIFPPSCSLSRIFPSILQVELDLLTVFPVGHTLTAPVGVVENWCKWLSFWVSKIKRQMSFNTGCSQFICTQSTHGIYSFYVTCIQANRLISGIRQTSEATRGFLSSPITTWAGNLQGH